MNKKINRKPSVTIKKLVLALGLSALLGACTLAPRYERPQIQGNIPLPAAREDVTLRAHEIGWSHYFTDERLKALIAIGLKNNYDIQKALLNLKKADAEYGLSIYNLIPNLATSGINKSRLGPVDHDEKTLIQQKYSSGLGVTNFELDLYRKVDTATAAGAAYKASAFDELNAQITVIAKIAKKYFEVRINEEILGNAKKTLAYQKELYHIQNLRYRAGVISALDLLNNQNALDMAQSQFMDVKDNYTTSVNQLAILIGGPLPADLPAAAPLTKQVSYVVFPQDLPAEILVFRPDIRSVEERLKQSNAQIGVARAAFLPRVTLNGQINASSEHFNDLFKSGNMGWVAGPSVSIPLFDIFPNTMNLRISKIAKEQMIVEYNNAIQLAFLEVVTALNTYDKLREQYSLSERIMRNNRKARDLTRLRFNQGIADRHEMLDAENRYVASQNDFLKTQQIKLFNEVDLYTSLGGGVNEVTTVLMYGPEKDALPEDEAKAKAKEKTL